MDDLKITIIQSDLVWESPTENFVAFGEKLEVLEEPTDLIILPEMFNTGFSSKNPEISESMDGPTVSWMKETAAKMKAVIVGSVIILEDEKTYNRMIWMRPDGTFETYDKRHLFAFAGEDEHFTAGTERKIVELKGWKICLQVCYDLRFPVFARNTNDDRYDLLLYVANWPAARRFPWSQLLIARAIENQCYVAGVNRVGLDGNDIDYSGDSAVIDPKGEEISSVEPSVETAETVQLSWEELEAFRAKFPVLNDADDFEVKL